MQEKKQNINLLFSYLWSKGQSQRPKQADMLNMCVYSLFDQL